MSIVTEKIGRGVRLRIVVPQVTWDRVQQVSERLGLDEREVLLVSLGLGVWFLGAAAKPVVIEDQDASDVLHEVGVT